MAKTNWRKKKSFNHNTPVRVQVVVWRIYVQIKTSRVYQLKKGRNVGYLLHEGSSELKDELQPNFVCRGAA